MIRGRDSKGSFLFTWDWYLLDLDEGPYVPLHTVHRFSIWYDPVGSVSSRKFLPERRGTVLPARSPSKPQVDPTSLDGVDSSTGVVTDSFFPDIDYGVLPRPSVVTETTRGRSPDSEGVRM